MLEQAQAIKRRKPATGGHFARHTGHLRLLRLSWTGGLTNVDGAGSAGFRQSVEKFFALSRPQPLPEEYLNET